MNPTKQRIAIATACGWKHVCVTRLDGTDRFWGHEPGKPVEAYGKSGNVPDYVNDLNAMYQAELTLSYEDHDKFRKFLYCGTTARTLNTRLFVTSTAAERAEAFLRALDLWEEE